ncbi:MAG: type VI secretion system baseplate subunit TssG [Candidatus Eisenbacteria bacterium]
MAAAERTPLSDLIRRLRDEARRTSFFQLVQRLRRAEEHEVPCGAAGPPAGEGFRFRPSTRLSFAPTDVDDLTVLQVESDGVQPSRKRFRITVNFLGLYGPASPMPNHYSEEILWSAAEGERVRDFLDLFHHRLISFVFRAWERVRHPILFNPDAPDPATRRATCLVGLGTEGMLAALGASPLPLVRAAGLLNCQHRSAAALEALLRDHFQGEVAVTVESCVERRVRLRSDQRTRLGGPVGRLGADACLGQTIADIAGSFRVACGPLAVERFRELLPGCKGMARLAGLVRFFVPAFLDFDLRLRLRRGEAPACRLAPELGLPLGQMTWLLPADDAEEQVIVPARGSDPLYRHSAA